MYLTSAMGLKADISLIVKPCPLFQISTLKLRNKLVTLQLVKYLFQYDNPFAVQFQLGDIMFK